MTERRHVLLAWICAAAAIAYLQRSGISVAAGQIMRTLHLDKPDLSIIMSAWGFGYAALQIPSGWLADRFGALRILVLLVAAWSLATGAVALAYDWQSLLVLWTIMGIAQAGMVPCAAKAIGAAFPVPEHGTASGLLGSAMLAGGAIAPSLTAVLLQRLSWEAVFACYALPGLVWAGLFTAWARTLPRITTPVADMDRIRVQPANGIATSPHERQRPLWRRMIVERTIWLLCSQQFLRAAAMIFFATWFPTYLEEARGVTTLEAGVFTTWAGAGAMLGSILGGLVSDYLLRRTGNSYLSRQGIAVLGMLACAALILAAYFTSDTRMAVTLIGLGAFCGAFGGVSGYTVAIKYGGRHVATVLSTMNMWGNIGAGIFPLVAGWLVHRFGLWDPVLFMFAGIFVVDAICWAALNPRSSLDTEEARDG
jgi:sugar phosphate permease